MESPAEMNGRATSGAQQDCTEDPEVVRERVGMDMGAQEAEIARIKNSCRSDSEIGPYVLRDIAECEKRARRMNSAVFGVSCRRKTTEHGRV